MSRLRRPLTGLLAVVLLTACGPAVFQTPSGSDATGPLTSASATTATLRVGADTQALLGARSPSS